MKPSAFSIAVAIIVITASCRKNDYHPPEYNVTDPLVNETFGERLTLETDNATLLWPVVWGYDSKTIFVPTTHGIIYEMNIATNDKQQLLLKEKEASVVQSIDDGLVFLAVADGGYGYFKLNLTTSYITQLNSFNRSQSSAVYVGDENMFEYKGDVVTQGRPCESWDDFFCGVYSITQNLRLRHKKFDTGSEVELRPDVAFQNYSPDGSTALLATYDKCYLFNVSTQVFYDSLPLAPAFSNHSFHWTGSDIFYSTFQFGSSDIVIYDLKKNQEANRFHTALLITDFIGWPRDAQKIFYTGACTTSDCTYAIYELDLNTMAERRLVSTSAGDLLTSPFQVVPSPDGKAIIFNDGYATYIKKPE